MIIMLEFIHKLLFGHTHRYGESINTGNIVDSLGDTIGIYYDVQCQVCGKIKRFACYP